MQMQSMKCCSFGDWNRSIFIITNSLNAFHKRMVWLLRTHNFNLWTFSHQSMCERIQAKKTDAIEKPKQTQCKPNNQYNDLFNRAIVVQDVISATIYLIIAIIDITQMDQSSGTAIKCDPIDVHHPQNPAHHRVMPSTRIYRIVPRSDLVNIRSETNSLYFAWRTASQQSKL